MKLQNLALPALNNGKTTAILTALNISREYEDGKATGKNLGFTYTIALPGNQLEKISVKIPGDTPLMEQEAIDAATASMNFVLVEFTNFKARSYQNFTTKELLWTATADGIKLAVIGGKNS